MNKVYKINFGTLISMLVPQMLRRTKMFALSVALIKPLVFEYDRFLAWSNDAVYRVSHNGSVILLTKILNDRFDPEDRGIKIRTVKQQDALRFFPEAENRQLGFFPLSSGKQLSFHPSLEYNPDAADFVIEIPSILRPGTIGLEEKLLTQMRGQIDYYKLYAKKCTLKWID